MNGGSSKEKIELSGSGDKVGGSDRMAVSRQVGARNMLRNEKAHIHTRKTIAMVQSLTC